MSFNLVVLEGRLTRDPEIKSVGSTQVCKFALAVSRKYKDTEETIFMDIAVWGAQAPACGQYLKKGSNALVQGTLKEERWTSNDGTPKTKIVVNADKVVFLGGKKSDQEDQVDQAPMPFGKANQGMSKMDPSTGQGELELGGLGLPF